jgi:hypothetical protein
MNEILSILEELRGLVANDSNAKDNVLLDLLDSLVETITKIDQKPSTTINSTKLDLLPLEAILKESSLTIRTIIEEDNKRKKEFDNKILEVFKLLKVDNSKELNAINETLKNKPITTWTFDIIRDKNGNMQTITAKPNGNN